MKKKLTKNGNSLAVILDKAALLKVLNITAETELKIKTDKKSIIITPINTHLSENEIRKRKSVQKAVEEIMEKYSPALKKLAKN